MFRLCKEIQYNKLRISRFISNNSNLRRPGYAVNGNMPEHLFFCKGHILVARSRNLVNFRNTLRAKRKRRHGLGTAELINLIDSRDMRSSQNMGAYRPISITWCCQKNLLNTRNLGRNDIHEQRRRIGRFSPRHIEHHTLKRRYSLAENNTVILLMKEAFFSLKLMKHRYVFVSLFKNRDEISVSFFIRIADLVR